MDTFATNCARVPNGTRIQGNIPRQQQKQTIYGILMKTFGPANSVLETIGIQKHTF